MEPHYKWCRIILAYVANTMCYAHLGSINQQRNIRQFDNGLDSRCPIQCLSHYFQRCYLETISQVATDTLVLQTLTVMSLMQHKVKFVCCVLDIIHFCFKHFNCCAESWSRHHENLYEKIQMIVYVFKINAQSTFCDSIYSETSLSRTLIAHFTS